MAREIIDLTRTPSPVDRKPDIRQLQHVDRKPVIKSIPVTPLGPAKRVPAASVKKGQGVSYTGKTPVVKREAQTAVKQEPYDDTDIAFDSLSLTARTPKPVEPPRSSVLDSLLKSKAAYSFLSDSDDEPTLPARRASPLNAQTKIPSKPAVSVTQKTPAKPAASAGPSMTKSTARTPRRHIRDPDSESEASPSHRAASFTPSPHPPTLTRATQTPRAGAPSLSKRKPTSRKDVRQYFDLYAGAADADSEEEEEDEDRRRKKDQDWMDKYYDDSMGSLRDFIVPDDYESSEEDDSERSAEETSDEEDVKVVHSDDGAMEDVDSDDEVVAIDSDGGVLHFSPPPRLLNLPDLGGLKLEDLDSDSDASPTSSHIPRTPGKSKSHSRVAPTPKGKTPSKKAWATERTSLAQGIFDELDKKVFGRKLGKGEGGAGALLEWSNRLLTTAGTAHSKWTRQGDGSRTETVKIVLSEKVLTGREQILSTVAHEMCHLASWVISNERKNPHGRVFKSWGAKVMRARPDIEVTTKHAYEIEYKYSWKCTGTSCNKIYKRHSKSIDITKQRCGRCRGTLEPMFETRESSPFQVYLKAHMANAKASMPGESHAAVMRALSARWKEGEGAESHVVYWGAMARAARS